MRLQAGVEVIDGQRHRAVVDARMIAEQAAEVGLQVDLADTMRQCCGPHLQCGRLVDVWRERGVLGVGAQRRQPLPDQRMRLAGPIGCIGSSMSLL